MGRPYNTRRTPIQNLNRQHRQKTDQVLEMKSQDAEAKNLYTCQMARCQ